MRRILAAALFALYTLAPLCAAAQAISAEEAQAVRKVVEAQLDAFKQDDAARAFSYATSGIRASFGTAENFMAMVKSSYPVVYRPQSVSFDAPLRIGGELVQPVRMTDAEGRAWIALYPMQEEDGAWRINGCQLGRSAGQST